MKTDQTKPQLAISVIDSGVGIEDNKLQDIFDPFVQADTSVTRRFGGTGLGLAISKRFARALGGDIRVTSTPDKGSEFTVYVDTGPLDGVRYLQPEDLLTSTVTDEVDDQQRWQFPPGRILVVDDGAENRDLVKLVLQDTGLQIDEAKNGAVCLDMSTRHSYKAILMDVQMPVMDGFTAAGKLRERGYTGPIVAMTGNAMKGFDQECLQAGYSDYMTKPIEINALLQKLGELLGGKPVAHDVRAPVADPAVAQSVGVEVPANSEPLVSRLANDARFHPVISRFVEKFRSQFELMSSAWQRQDLDELARLAHWLKGSGGTVGFDDFTEPAEALERFSKQGQKDQVDRYVREIQLLAGRMAEPEAIKTINNAAAEPII